MSFSGEIKEELSKVESGSRHCQVAELASIISLCGAVVIDANGKYSLKIHTENLAVSRKYFTLLEKTFNIRTDTAVRINKQKGNISYYVVLKDHEMSKNILDSVKLLDMYGDVTEELSVIRNKVIRKLCCKRAYLRGAFLASGSMSAPEKSYHLEIVCPTEEKALQLQEIMKFFRLDAKVVSRKKMYIVYLKEGDQISDMLGVMEAYEHMEKFEGIRDIKEMRNTVNRKVNCETANINKTVSAAMKQIEDIEFIQEVKGLDKLPESLRDIAVARMNYPEASLKELGTLVHPNVGKSGVNHRLRKLSEMAETLRGIKEGYYD